MTTAANIPFSYAWAQTTGTAHVLRGVPCEDTMGLTTITDKDGTSWLIAAVADGAGSASCAGAGSRIATESFIEAAGEMILTGGAVDLPALMRAAAVYAQAMLHFVAEEAGHDLADYHTTLLACVSNGQVSAFLQIGDGAILIREQGSTAPAWRLVFAPQNGEERNLTVFLTLPDAFDLIQFAVIEAPLTHVAMTTDGLQDILLHSGTLEVRTVLLERLKDALDANTEPGDAEAISAGLHAVLDSTVVRLYTSDDTSLLTVRLSPPT